MAQARQRQIHAADAPLPDPVADAVADATALVVRFTDLDLKALAPYDQACQSAHQALNQAFTLLVIGKGIDPEQHDCQRTPDGRAFVKRPRAHTAE